MVLALKTSLSWQPIIFVCIPPLRPVEVQLHSFTVNALIVNKVIHIILKLHKHTIKAMRGIFEAEIGRTLRDIEFRAGFCYVRINK